MMKKCAFLCGMTALLETPYTVLAVEDVSGNTTMAFSAESALPYVLIAALGIIALCFGFVSRKFRKKG